MHTPKKSPYNFIPSLLSLCVSLFLNVSAARLICLGISPEQEEWQVEWLWKRLLLCTQLAHLRPFLTADILTRERAAQV